MLTSTDIGDITSIEGAMAKGVTVCIMQAQQSSLLGNYPALKTKPTLNTAESLKSLDAGLCGAAVMEQPAWVNLQNSHCDKVQVGNPLYSVPLGMPIREEFVPAFSWAINQLVLSGVYRQEELFAKGVYLAGSSCDESADSTTENVITLRQFSGPLVITMLCSTIGLMITTLSVYAHRQEEKVRHAAEVAAASLRMWRETHHLHVSTSRRTKLHHGVSNGVAKQSHPKLGTHDHEGKAAGEGHDEMSPAVKHAAAKLAAKLARKRAVAQACRPGASANVSAGYPPVTRAEPERSTTGGTPPIPPITTV
jgi:hypothetical protein